MGRVNYINHKNKKILHIDFSNLNKDEILEVIEEAKSMIVKEPLNSILTLSDFTNISFDKTATKNLEEYAEHNKPYVKAGALLGITGLKKIIYNAILKITGRKLEVFSDAKPAKEWLIKF